MAKRRKRKSQKPKVKNIGGLTPYKLKNLKKQAQNARKRMYNFLLRSDATDYITPDPTNYTLVNLLQRIADGESYSAIIKELKNINAASIRKATPEVFTSDSGFVLDSELYASLQKSVSRANKNIREARKKFADFPDLMPTEFNLSQLIADARTYEGVINTINDLALFTPKNLTITDPFGTGEAATFAEVQYYRNILERENERRRQLSEEQNPQTREGYFLQQEDIDTREIDIQNIPSIADLKRRAGTWSENKVMDYANRYLDNYLSALNNLEEVLLNSYYWNDTVGQRFDYIRSVISQLYYNDKAITYAVRNVPDASIQLITGVISGELDFNAIYEAWIDIEDMFIT